jgi:hypothetical protein
VSDETKASEDPDFDDFELTDEQLAELADELSSQTLGAIKFDALSPTDFEEFCFDLISASGFSNVDWRKGTPKNSSPSDRGRDIVAELERVDVDGHTYRERWFIDCKHYERGVPPEALQGTITWAQAERPDTVLFIASGFFSNGAKDWIAQFQDTRPPFRVRTWEAPQLRRIVADHLDVAFRHNVEISSLRRVADILEVESELTDKLWYGRKPHSNEALPNPLPADIWEQVQASKRAMEERYGAEELMRNVETDWAWGYLSGKVAAIRWVLGYEWDMIDS